MPVAGLKRPRAAIGLLGGSQAEQFHPGETLATALGVLRELLARESEYRTGFLWLPIAFGLGILLYFAAHDEPALWAGPALAALALVPSIRAHGLARMIALAVLFAALGFSAASLRTASVASPMLERDLMVEVKGFVETLDATPSRQRLTLRPTAVEGLDAARLPFRLRIGAPGRSGANPGDFVVLKARLAPPSEAAMPGGYDFRRESFFRGIGGVGYAIGAVKLEAPPGIAPLDLRINAAIDRWRNALTDRIALAIGGDAGALSAALVTGKRGLIPEGTNDDLRASGLYHIVSISGLHMVLAAGVLFWLVRALLAAIPAIALTHPIKKYAAVVAMIGASFYCVFSGSEVATERSLIMTLVMLGAILVDRPALAMRNLAISALIVLAREPESLLGPSFQMSFAAVASLIAGNQIWRDWRAGHPHVEHGPLGRGIRKLALAFLGIVATTLVATLATAPFSAFHFHRLNLYGLIGNSLAIPLVSLVVMPAAVTGTLLLPFGLDGIIWKLMGQGVAGVLIVAERVATIENAAFPVARMPGYSFALLVGALLTLVALRTRLRWASLGLFGLWGASVHAVALPDIVIDPTGRLALIRGEEGRFRVLAIGTASRFTLSQWLPALGDPRRPDDPTLRHKTRCDKEGCTARLHNGQQVALVARPAALREDCRRADIVITPLAGIVACDRIKLLARAHFDRYGATRIFLPAPARNSSAALSPSPGEWQLETGLDPATDRPWRRRAKPDSSATTDPLAPSARPAIRKPASPAIKV